MFLLGLAIRIRIMIQYIPSISAEWQGVAAVWAFGDFCELALKPTAAATGFLTRAGAKAMKKIESNADVLEWAHSIVTANGEKFTALSKGDQFAIAKFIVDSDEAEPMAEEEQPKDESPKGNLENSRLLRYCANMGFL